MCLVSAPLQKFTFLQPYSVTSALVDQEAAALPRVDRGWGLPNSVVAVVKYGGPDDYTISHFSNHDCGSTTHIPGMIGGPRLMVAAIQHVMHVLWPQPPRPSTWIDYPQHQIYLISIEFCKM